MASNRSLLCRVEVDGVDAPHRGTRLEAHRQVIGFSVWFWNDHLCRRGARIGVRYRPYSARALAQVIRAYDVHWRLYKHLYLRDPWRTVSVTGERGLRAEALRHVFTCGRAWPFLLPETTLDALDILVGEPATEERMDLANKIEGLAGDFGLGLDVGVWLRRYGLAASSASLRPLYDGLMRDYDRREDKQLAPLDPFADRIALILRAFERSSRPYSLGHAGIPQARMEDALRHYVEDYALAHGSLPTGQVRLLRRSVMGSEDATVPFDVDLDALAAMVARACAPLRLPATYRLPRRRRERFFEQKIEALVAAFDDRFIVERGPDGCGDRNQLRWFIRDYVVDYERLPRGRLRIEPALIPLARIWHDMGVVDFDALRQAAGVTDEPIGASAHSRDGTSR